MSRSRTLCVIALGTCLVVATSWPNHDHKAPDWGEIGFHRSVHWNTPAGKQALGGVYLFEAVRTGAVTRVLIEDDVGRPIILTRTVDALSGRDSYEILDDRTGWWARIDIDTGVTAEYLGAYNSIAMEELMPENQVTLGFKLTTRDGLAFERELPLVSSLTLPYQELAGALREAGLADQLAAEMPVGLSDATRFLDTSMSPKLGSHEGFGDDEAYPLRGVVEVLVNVTSSEPAEPSGGEGEPWVMTVGEIQKGIGVVDPSLLELVSRFRSVDNADPLSDHRAREVLSQDRDPNP